MFVYIVNLFITFILLLITRNNSVKSQSKVKRLIMIIFSLIIITSVSGFRYNVGTDFKMYESFFYIMPRFPLFGGDIETMFTLIGKISYFINPNSSTLMFYLISLWIYLLVYILAIKNVENYDLSIYLFITFGFFTSSMNGLRQWMAIPLIYFLIKSLSKKEFFKSFIYFVIAFLCHKSVVFLIPFIIMCYFIKKERTRFFIIILSILLYMNYHQLNYVILNLLGNINFFAKYVKYMTLWGEINTNVLVMPMFTLVSYLAYYIFVYKKKIECNEFDRMILNMLIFGFFTSLLGTKIHYFERIQYYFDLSLIFVLPYVYSKMPKSYKKIAMLFFIFMGLAFYVYSLNKNGANPLPYQTVFNKNNTVIYRR